MSRIFAVAVSAASITAAAQQPTSTPSYPPLPPVPQATSSLDRLASVRSGIEYICAGCEGDQVTLLQELLNENGATPKLAITGTWDSATATALKNFQRTHRDLNGDPLADDATVGPLTLGALEAQRNQIQIPEARSTEELRVARAADAFFDVRHQHILLHQSDRGPAVRELKKLLNQAGAMPRLRETEEFDRATHHALVSFQQAWAARTLLQPELQIPIDGLLRRRTLLALEKAAAEAERPQSGEAPSRTAARADFTTFERFQPLFSSLRTVSQETYDHYRAIHGVASQTVVRMTSGERKQIDYERCWIGGACGSLPEPLAIAHFYACCAMGTESATAVLNEACGFTPSRTMNPSTIETTLQYEPDSLTAKYLGVMDWYFRSLASQLEGTSFSGTARLQVALLQTTAGSPSASSSNRPAETSSESALGFDESLRAFQRKNGLPVSGELTPATIRRLRESATATRGHVPQDGSPSAFPSQIE